MLSAVVPDLIFVGVGFTVFRGRYSVIWLLYICWSGVFCFQ